MPKMIVCYSKIARKPQRSLFQRNFEDDVREVISSKELVERYSREWRFAKWEKRGGCLLGKFGFVTSGTTTAKNWDDTKWDFIDQQVKSNYIDCVLWVLDISTQQLAFEIRPPFIEYQSFKGAFQAFLDLYPNSGLVFEDYVSTPLFLAWVKNDIERIVSFKANLRTPNPDFSKETDYIYESLERTKADVARIEFKKLENSDDSLSTEGTIEQIVKYGETGYSTIKAEGKKGDLTKTFDSKRRIYKERVNIPEQITDDEKWNTIMHQLRKFNDGK